MPEYRDPVAERRRLAGDPHRPAYHFVAPSEWLNDPNGTIFWRGRHHLFYQYNPEFSAGGGPVHWGHAYSEDLVHWTDLPIAISPEPGTYDEHGIWSGSCCEGDGFVAAIYHAHQSGNCIATSKDDLLVTWTKHPANPVIPPDPARIYDPCIWREGDVFYSLSGRITEATLGHGGDVRLGGNDVAYLFRSRDLKHWTDLGAFYTGGEFTEPGEDCAVPDFFPLGDRHCLLFAAHSAGGQYYTGIYADEHFTPTAHGRFNFNKYATDLGRLVTSGDVNAPISWVDPTGRRIMVCWLTEGKTWDAQRLQGWAGAMSLPRLIDVAPDGTLLQSPVPELETLRRDPVHFADLAIGADSSIPLNGVSGDSLEIAAVIDPGDAAQVGLLVRCSPQRACAPGDEESVITVDREHGTLRIDVDRASLSEEMVGRDPQVAPFVLADGEAISLRIFIDHSILEVYANGRQCVTKRLYPARRDSLGVKLFAHGGAATARSIDVWRMASIWPT
jgi:beta-fructofuranosidase